MPGAIHDPPFLDQRAKRNTPGRNADRVFDLGLGGRSPAR